MSPLGEKTFPIEGAADAKAQRWHYIWHDKSNDELHI